LIDSLEITTRQTFHFFTTMFQAKEISDLKERISALETELANAKGESATVTAELDSLKTKLGIMEAEATQAGLDLANRAERVTELEALLSSRDGEITALKTDFEQKIEDEVVSRCAAAGIAPIARDPEAGTKEGDPKPPAAKGLTGIAKARAALAAKHSETHGKN
jgi:septal ring factor EnvC (AmiA/AmiB activator)